VPAHHLGERDAVSPGEDLEHVGVRAAHRGDPLLLGATPAPTVGAPCPERVRNTASTSASCSGVLMERTSSGGTEEITSTRFPACAVPSCWAWVANWMPAAHSAPCSAIARLTRSCL